MWDSRKLKGALSPFIHFLVYRFQNSKMQLENGMLITSVDIDVGNKMLGVLNKGKNDRNVNHSMSEYFVGKIEEQALPLIIDFFDAFEIPATFAIRGQLLEVDTSILESLLKSSIRHDIGSHSYYHRDFRGLSYDEVESELKLVSAAMRKFKITPKSFIFPKNHVAYLDLLEKHGYKCYRGYGNFPYFGMYIRKHGRLYDVHPSLFIGDCTNAMLIKNLIDLSIKNRLPFHVWFHPWNLGLNRKSILTRIRRVFFPLFKYAKSKDKKGLLTIETMVSAAEKMEKFQS